MKMEFESPDDIQFEKDGKKKAREEGADFCHQFDADAVLKKLICVYYDNDAEDLLNAFRELFWGSNLEDRKVTGTLKKYLKK